MISGCKRDSSRSYLADVVLAVCGDRLVDHLLTADAQEHFFHLVQELLQKKHPTVLLHTTCNIYKSFPNLYIK
jgi:hypothetical protein